ncbi:MAG: FtsW/RodA/SpoVE family cell cycle protein, partial [Elusimicrobiota bacterium]
MSRRAAGPDYGLLALTFLLLAFGTIMMCSASAILADTQMHDPLYFIKRQALWGILGLGAMAFLSRMDYNRLREWVWPALFACLLALILVLFTRPVAGVKRWIRL